MIVENSPAKGDSAKSGLPKANVPGRGAAGGSSPAWPTPPFTLPDLYKTAELWGRGHLLCCVQGTAQKAVAFAPVSRVHELQDPGSGRRLELLPCPVLCQPQAGCAQDPNPDLSDLEVGAVFSFLKIFL